MPKIVTITLDGPAGVGKSSLAKALGQKLHIPVLDTGAMFRCVALFLGEAGLRLSEEELKEKLAELDYGLSGCGPESQLVCNGHAVGQEIRNENIGALASKLAALPLVRTFLKDKQQEIGRHFSLVAEGRDMGTVVFPQASPKFFLDADPLVRAQRRQHQLAGQGIKADLNELSEQIRLRDHQDRNRDIAPLKAADDAIIIDTSELTKDEVLAELLKHVR